jgi:hypothetical protein
VRGRCFRPADDSTRAARVAVAGLATGQDLRTGRDPADPADLAGGDHGRLARRDAQRATTPELAAASFSQFTPITVNSP